ncbi:TadE/TadG family type IV pilus assembly protein [Vibrio comitans]|uniref:TadE-like domain-containing protein n=1 Tax=Vibrio comitans NBRC 102076 TaxID=1219078 RepID=A0A4Y3IJX3_9VIBR|nr:TadE family protein [Vibrio comitans]GEA59050.1 hypothetical protein VCO01S_02430 [Vibrio comitans NBRC 102076]
MKRSSYLKEIRGLASVEMTIIVPILMIIMVGIFELTQIIQANNIIISISREGANLISRNTTQTPEQVMNTVASTADPLDLEADGIIYVNLVYGRAEGEAPQLLEQYRWASYGYSANSSTWNGCDTWGSDGECDLPESEPELSDFPLELDEGEAVYVVEVIYRYSPISTYIFDSDITIKELTYL